MHSEVFGVHRRIGDAEERKKRMKSRYMIYVESDVIRRFYGDLDLDMCRSPLKRLQIRLFLTLNRPLKALNHLEKALNHLLKAFKRL